MKSFGITCAILLVVGVSLCQAQSPLIEAHTSAMRLEAVYEEDVDFYRDRLTTLATDLAFYFTARMRLALMAATTAQQGAGLRICARNAADQSVVHISRFHSTIKDLEDDSTALHQTVWEQLMETDILNQFDQFYNLHSTRLAAAETRIQDHHRIELGTRWIEIFTAYDEIAADMDACIAAIALPMSD